MITKVAVGFNPCESGVHGEKGRVLPLVVVLSEHEAQLYEPSGREVCISVTGPSKRLPDLSARFLAVLRISFSDITEPIDHPDYLLFNPQHAEEIVNFARQWAGVDCIVIHCHAGMSRSPGIAMALCELFGFRSATTWERSHPMWNKWVRGELVRVGRELLQQRE
jgi:hypothetical protein